MFPKFYILCLLITYVTGQVKVLTPDDFDTVVDGSKSVFVKFYAPWCGHCKSFAPELDKAGDAFKGIDDVVIAKFDADAHKEFARRFDIKGYPTLKFFPKGSTKAINYEGGRTAEDVIKFVNEKAGSNAKIIEPPSIVTVLNADNFDSIALDTNKDVLVEFYAPWCGHCKKLAPVWEKLAQVFEQDKNVVIAKVDATVDKELASKYEVKGYPTLKYFPSGPKKQAEPYEGGRTLGQFVQFINEKAGTRRDENGALKPSVGRIPALDKIAHEIYQGNTNQIEELQKLCSSEHSEKDCEYYIKFAQSLKEKGKDYIEKERTRLQGLAKSLNVVKDKKDGFILRYNILSGFVEGPEKIEQTKQSDDNKHEL